MKVTFTFDVTIADSKVGNSKLVESFVAMRLHDKETAGAAWQIFLNDSTQGVVGAGGAKKFLDKFICHGVRIQRIVCQPLGLGLADLFTVIQEANQWPRQ